MEKGMEVRRDMIPGKGRFYSKFTEPKKLRWWDFPMIIGAWLCVIPIIIVGAAAWSSVKSKRTK